MISTTNTTITIIVNTRCNTSSSKSRSSNRSRSSNNTLGLRLIDERSLSLVERPSGSSARHRFDVAAGIQGEERIS